MYFTKFLTKFIITILILSIVLSPIMAFKSRFLHFVLKIGDFKQNIDFFRDKLRMTVLRHEVFDEGCGAACNGPYDNKWSKTMIGYGPESDNFVLELTYNYTVGSYKLGNDYQFIKIALTPATFAKVAANESQSPSDQLTLKSPDGYTFIIVKDQAIARDEITEVCLSTSDVEKSTSHWRNVLQMSGVSENTTESLQKYTNPSGQTSLRFKRIEGPIDHGTAFGRMAYSTPASELPKIQALQEKANLRVLTPLLTLPTPGKADVQVVIIEDTNGHEICYVGEKGFDELSQVDPKANDLVEKSIAEDKSREWYEKKGLTKKQA